MEDIFFFSNCLKLVEMIKCDIIKLWEYINILHIFISYSIYLECDEYFWISCKNNIFAHKLSIKN